MARHRPQIPTGDLFQGRGTYVVDVDGLVAYAHIAESASDIPPIDELMARVRELGRAREGAALPAAQPTPG
ncbi:hypothetical protein NBH00_02925 [Paraconexibacter antarcticus]|uniref:Redoxin domain-containing protein n=1 Tax=Paraconexibacter antarcticus TaxID=2949664 RepID=A0ABY5DU24_9ACTN|nr:hypothetical protein [Paraconexibacter antarcticus]UTI65171.1 hypothetical protein NBH00_02925 [Paraconexibacter antarcticus]